MRTRVPEVASVAWYRSPDVAETLKGERLITSSPAGVDAGEAEVVWGKKRTGGNGREGEGGQKRARNRAA
ncbi:MAG: hypothetical protein QM760_16795 [Nibricoccus sp.]